jgi:AraC-like DNA-binding protein
MSQPCEHHLPEQDPASFSDRVALRVFVDACQVLVGQLEGNQKESTAGTRLILILMRLLRRAEGASSRHATTNFRVMRVVKYLEDAFADPTICLASAARQVDVTPSHLDRLIKEHTGVTFLQQLRRIRIRHADRLLRTTTSSIKETAYACGYTSPGSFGRDFRRVHGCSPTEWRDLRAAVSAQVDRPTSTFGAEK